MHELAIVEGILGAVIPEAEKHQVKKILHINMRIGELSGVVESCMQEYFTIASKGTIAEGSKLILKPSPIRITCPDCGYDGTIQKGQYACPDCGSFRFKIISGREYYIESIEAE
ncbi:MAG: hydrogenase maturation nickel metallochaperone HypA [Lachnospiraceae bacterium]|nr:hydrogenase maturation nickel metallochaperone HypA [Lachnospiraceae bacterium]